MWGQVAACILAAGGYGWMELKLLQRKGEVASSNLLYTKWVFISFLLVATIYVILFILEIQVADLNDLIKFLFAPIGKSIREFT